MNNKSGGVDEDKYYQWHDKILAPVSDNLKTAESLVVVQDLLKDKNVNNATKLALIEFVDELLGLQFMDRATKLHELESEIAPENIQFPFAEDGNPVFLAEFSRRLAEHPHIQRQNQRASVVFVPCGGIRKQNGQFFDPVAPGFGKIIFGDT